MISGFEHQDGWGGADRGLVAGAIYGTALLVAHAIAGTHAKVSLGSFPPLLAVITAIVGMLLSALGGRLARVQRERTGSGAPSRPPARWPVSDERAAEPPPDYHLLLDAEEVPGRRAPCGC